VVPLSSLGATQAWTVSDLRTCLAFNTLQRNSADFSGYFCFVRRLNSDHLMSLTPPLQNIGQEFDGSDSDARPDEAVSWGKTSEVLEGYKLDDVDKEVALVANILSQPEGIVTPTQSAQEAIDVLTSSHIFHYAGRTLARQGLMDSAFALESELKLRDIIHAPLRHPVLAYLPEFTTYTSGSTPGLATGMLLSGFKSIVTTTWCVTKSAALAIYLPPIVQGCGRRRRAGVGGSVLPILAY
jgi:hypothetical protein